MQTSCPVLFPPNRYEDAQRLHLAVRSAGIARSFGAIHDDVVQARCCEPASNVVPLEAQPEISQLFALPFVIVRVEIGARLGEANSLTAFGNLALAEEDHATARERFDRAWGIYREIGERHGRTYVALRLARTLLALNEVDKAQQILEEGADLARQIDGHPNLTAITQLLDQIKR
jgi:hypothetical protein